jgi:hypothetical protein
MAKKQQQVSVTEPIAQPKPVQMCMNCQEKPATKSGQCDTCYHRQWRQNQPEAIQHRTERWVRERRHLVRDLMAFIHRLDQLNEKQCFSNRSVAQQFRLDAWKFLEELQSEDRPVGLATADAVAKDDKNLARIA